MNIEKSMNPYIRPFRPRAKDLFFGRDKDVDLLFSIIIDNKIVIFYALSGADKTSIINACISALQKPLISRIFLIALISTSIMNARRKLNKPRLN